MTKKKKQGRISKFLRGGGGNFARWPEYIPLSTIPLPDPKRSKSLNLLMKLRYLGKGFSRPGQKWSKGVVSWAHEVIVAFDHNGVRPQSGNRRFYLDRYPVRDMNYILPAFLVD